MSLAEALLLGVVQGLTEFLPISSSGHLVLLQHILGWGTLPEGLVLAFDTTLHLGTLLAVVAVFWPDLLGLAAAWWQGLRQRRPAATAGSRLAWWTILGTVPAVLVGLLFEEPLQALFGAPRAAGALLLATALLLVLAEVLGRGRRDLGEMTWLDSALIGIAQAAAIAPGLSRSGTTMAAGMFRRLGREAAVRFSFLLSVPIIAGTGALHLLKVLSTSSWREYLPALFLGFLAAAVCGYAAIRLLLAYVRRRPLYPFAAYCALVGFLALTLLSP